MRKTDMSAFFDDEYESLCAAMGMIDAASDILSNIDDWHGAEINLTYIRNQLNDRRLEILGNSKGEPHHVADLIGGKH